MSVSSSHKILTADQPLREFLRLSMYVLVPADEASNNIVVVCRLHYNNTSKQEQNGTKAYEEETSTDEKTVVIRHSNELPLTFSVGVKVRQEKLLTIYLLHKLHKRPFKARFIAKASSCTTTELSKLSTCLTAVKSHVISYYSTEERSRKDMFWSIIKSGEVLSKLKSRGFRATSLSIYDLGLFNHITP